MHNQKIAGNNCSTAPKMPHDTKLSDKNILYIQGRQHCQYCTASYLEKRNHEIGEFRGGVMIGQKIQYSKNMFQVFDTMMVQYKKMDTQKDARLGCRESEGGQTTKWGTSIEL